MLKSKYSSARAASLLTRAEAISGMPKTPKNCAQTIGEPKGNRRPNQGHDSA
jgi:hypothetical protein